jgi:hypothetical protein
VQDVPKLLHRVLYLLETGSKSEYVLISESSHANEARRNYSVTIQTFGDERGGRDYIGADPAGNQTWIEKCLVHAGRLQMIASFVVTNELPHFPLAPHKPLDNKSTLLKMPAHASSTFSPQIFMFP